MFKASVLHRDALIRVLTVRGDGDLLAGWKSTSLFTRKATQWYAPTYYETRSVLTVHLLGARSLLLFSSRRFQYFLINHKPRRLSLNTSSV